MTRAAGAGLALAIGLPCCRGATPVRSDVDVGTAEEPNRSEAPAASGSQDAGTPASLDLDNVVLLEETGIGSCAMQSDGSVWCWTAPDDRAGLETRVAALATQLAVGSCFACARTRQGEVDCWDRGKAWELPSRVRLSAPALDLAIGDRITPDGCSTAVAALDDGKLASWTTLENPMDLDEARLPGLAAHVATDGSSVCAQLQSGAVLCRWRPKLNPAKAFVEGPLPDGKLHPVPALAGASDFFVRDLCVEGLLAGRVVRTFCVGERRELEDGLHVSFHPHVSEARQTAEQWRAARDGGFVRGCSNPL